MPTFRVQVLSGPTHLWVDLPSPRLGVGRALGPILIALIAEPPRGTLAWEIPLTPWSSVFGALGKERFLGLRVREGPMWLGGMIRGGRLWVWSGFYF